MRGRDQPRRHNPAVGEGSGPVRWPARATPPRRATPRRGKGAHEPGRAGLARPPRASKARARMSGRQGRRPGGDIEERIVWANWPENGIEPCVQQQVEAAHAPGDREGEREERPDPDEARADRRGAPRAASRSVARRPGRLSSQPCKPMARRALVSVWKFIGPASDYSLVPRHPIPVNPKRRRLKCVARSGFE